MKTINEYEQKAIDFLSKCKVDFKSEFIKHDFHFKGDKEKRDIYKLSLIRDNKNVSFRFGQSINKSCNEIIVPITDLVNEIEITAGFKLQGHDVSSAVSFKLEKIDNFEISQTKLDELIALMCENYNKSAVSYNKKIRSYERIRETASKEECAKFILSAIKRELSKKETKYIESDIKTPPTAYDLLSCLQKYEVGTFQDFCSEFGYNEDSISDNKLYKNVCEEYKKVCMIFTDEEIEEMQEIN